MHVIGGCLPACLLFCLLLHAMLDVFTDACCRPAELMPKYVDVEVRAGTYYLLAEVMYL